MSKETKADPKRSTLILALIFGSLVILILAAILIIKPFSSGSAGSNSLLSTMTQQELQIEKLRQEVLNIQLENERMGSFWDRISPTATILTAFVAVAGVLITIWRQTTENRRQKEQDLNQRELDRKQREIESLRRLDDKFTSIVANLGADSEPVQVSAAVSLLTYLKPEYEGFHEQVYLILLANLKIDHSPAINRILVEGLERAIRLRLKYAQEKGEPSDLDLSNASLYHINLSGLDLSTADLGFADLRLANLIGSNLFRARGYETNLEKAKWSRANLNEVRFRKANLRDAHLHDVNLVAADLKETDMQAAQFYRSKMQSAHLEGANLANAQFQEANLNDTYFLGSKLNRQALETIRKALNWKNAHFDEEIASQLENMGKN
jgi:uncharacterized protein YjbI with pentapeptide repeats